MASHGKAGKNAVPPGNLAKSATAPQEVLQEQAAEKKTRARGRTADVDVSGPSPSQPHVPQELQREATRPTSAGVKKRGDRRDMQPDPGMRTNPKRSK